VTSQQEKADRLAALHERERVFVIPNPWDAGTARLLAYLGFEALATTGAGVAFSLGKPDGSTSRDEMLAHVEVIAGATDLPVSADLEDGFGDEPDEVHDFILTAARTGIVGGSIEDRSYGRGARPMHQSYDLDFAAERIRAAADAARSLPFRFTLTARCENFLVGNTDLADTIRRLQAYQAAGADCLYAPGLTTKAQIREVVAALDRPVNVVMGLVGEPIPVKELEELGVRRVSVGSALSRTALGSFVAAATELRDQSTFGFASGAISHPDLCKIFAS